jgi:hypothetical protein
MVTSGIQGALVEESDCSAAEIFRLLNVEGEITPSALQVFREQFVNPLQAELAGSMRVTFELPVDGGVGISCFDALDVDANEP